MNNCSRCGNPANASLNRCQDCSDYDANIGHPNSNPNRLTASQVRILRIAYPTSAVLCDRTARSKAEKLLGVAEVNRLLGERLSKSREEWDWDIDVNFFGGQIIGNQKKLSQPRKPSIPSTEPPADIHASIQTHFQNVMGVDAGRIDLMSQELDIEVKVLLNSSEFLNMIAKAIVHRNLRHRQPLTMAVSRPGPDALSVLKNENIPFVHLDWSRTKKLNVLGGSVQNQKTLEFINEYNRRIAA